MKIITAGALAFTWLAGVASATGLAPCGKNHYILEEPCAIVATSAAIGIPTGVAVDSAGTVYVSSHNIVLRVTASGMLERVAGNGIRGFAGDGGPASSALLATPSYADSAEEYWSDDYGSYGAHIAFDASDNLYIADSFNDRIRKVDAADGMITTYLGGAARLTEELGWPPEYWGFIRPYGVAVDSKGRVHVSASGMLLRVPTEDGPVALLSDRRYYWSLGGLAFDRDDNLFFTDYTCVVKKRAPEGTLTYVVTSKRCAGFAWPSEGVAYPAAVAIDNDGHLVIADTGNHCIRRKREGHELETIAGICGWSEAGFTGDGGPALEARMSSPMSVAVDRLGNVVVADRGNSRIRRITPQGMIETIAGNGSHKVLVED
jgi:sugar lactone lactonase YvrE